MFISPFLFLVFLLAIPAGITVDIIRSETLPKEDLPILFSMAVVLFVFFLTPFASRFSSLAERWRRFWRFTAGIYEFLSFSLITVFLYFSQTETQLYKIRNISDLKIIGFLLVYLGPFLILFIVSSALFYYDYIKKENENYIRTKERELLLVVLSGLVLLLSASQLYLAFMSSGEYFGKSPETIQYCFYAAYVFVIFQLIKNRKSEGGTNGGMLFFVWFIMSIVFFFIFPSILLLGSFSILLFSPILFDKKHKTEFSVLLFVFTTGIFLSRFFEFSKKIEIYRFDHHISLFLVLLLGNEMRKSILAWDSFRSSSLLRKIIFGYQNILFIFFSIWTLIYEIEEGVYSSIFGPIHSLSLHFSIGIFGYFAPNLWQNRREIASDMKGWVKKINNFAPCVLFIIGLFIFILTGTSKMSFDGSISVGSSKDEVKKVYGDPRVENAKVLKYFKVKVDNSPGVNLEESEKYLLEFELSSNRSCPGIKPGTVRSISINLRPRTSEYSYAPYRPITLEWYGVYGFDEENLSTKRLGELLSKLNLPVFTRGEDSNPTLGEDLYFNLPGKLEGEIIPVTFRYQKESGNVILNKVVLGDNSQDCLVNHVNRGVQNRLFDLELLSKIEWINKMEYSVFENVPAKVRPDENSPNAYIIPKGMILPLQIRLKEESKMAGKSGHWYFYKDAWVFDSSLRDISLISKKDYAELQEEDFANNGINFSTLESLNDQACSLNNRGEAYSPKPGTFLWSLQRRHVTLPFSIKSNSSNYSYLGFSDFPTFNIEDIYSASEELSEFSRAIRYSSLPSSSFSTKVRGLIEINFYCSQERNGINWSYKGSLYLNFRADDSDFISPKENELSFGSFKSFKKDFFLYFDSLDQAVNYCHALNMNLVTETELEKIYSEKDKYGLPMDQNYKSSYWWAGNKDAGLNILRTICVNR